MIKVICVSCQAVMSVGGESGARAVIDLHRIAQPGYVVVVVPS